MAFSAFVAPAAAQAPAVFPLDHFWTHAFDTPFAAAPAADSLRVYVPLRTGQLIALDPRTSAVVWSVELAVDRPPVVADGRLFVVAADAIHVLNAATGAVAWRLPAGPLSVPLTYRAGWLIVALADGALQGVRAVDGVVIWAHATGAPLASPPALDGNLLVAALTDGRIRAIDLTSGQLRWQRSLGKTVGSITVSGDRIFAGTDNGYFWSLEASDGDADWHLTRGAHLIGAAAADADRVYAVFLDNVVRAFNRGSGNEKWSFELPTRPLAGPQLIEGLLVITSGDMGAPGLTYINAATGAAAGKTPPLPKVDATTRAQYPVAIATSPSALAIITTATTSGDWQMHGYRQTFFIARAAPMTWGKRYDVRWRLDIRHGPLLWGIKVPLSPQVPLVPRVPQVPRVRF
ncbi:MAG: PQQ-binding-like beta-propeller repeat protein [Vicinamibacterales bacterium]